LYVIFAFCQFVSVFSKHKLLNHATKMRFSHILLLALLCLSFVFVNAQETAAAKRGPPKTNAPKTSKPTVKPSAYPTKKPTSKKPTKAPTMKPTRPTTREPTVMETGDGGYEYDYENEQD
jgi:hypothetical protein